MNYKKLAQQIIEVSRGNHSYLELSEKLKYRYDKVGKWVRGTRDINWSDFEQFCTVLNIDVKKAVQNTIHSGEIIKDTKTIAKFLIGERSIALAAKEMNFQPNRLRRITQGAEMRLSEMLQMIDSTYTSRLNVFVEEIAGDRLELMTELVEETTLSKRYKDLAAEDVSYSVAMKIFTLDTYKETPSHQVGFIADFLGVDQDREEEIISTLLEGGFIILQDKHYTPVKFHLVQCTRNEKYQIVKNFHQLGLEGLESGEEILDDNIYSCMDLVLSEETYQQVTKKLQTTFYEIFNLVNEEKENGNKEKVCYLNLQLFNPASIIKKRD